MHFLSVLKPICVSKTFFGEANVENREAAPWLYKKMFELKCRFENRNI